MPTGWTGIWAAAAGRCSWPDSLAPIIGRVCMDSCMIDITDIPGVKEGDEVSVFSPVPGNDLETMARVLDTISYEIMTSVSGRVKRSISRNNGMKCYDCGGLTAPGADKCPACNCPAERMQAVKCLETRLLTARVEAESALDQLGRAKVAMLCAAFFALVGGVVVLVHAGGDATMRARPGFSWLRWHASTRHWPFLSGKLR